MNLDLPIKSRLPGVGMDTSMVNGMRLLLSSATLLTLFIDPESAGGGGARASRIHLGHRPISAANGA
ncbi:hypothetical protein [Janthinobacterium sp. HLX7-2]|uniref:hypothetical protein n=1 Tax=Janthinobacterium sp. HLX7-2 TaxID=1259331 RepID=UPI003F2899FE